MKLLIATFASTLLAASAMAQSSDSSSTDASKDTSTETTSASRQSGAAAMNQEKVRQQLTDAGFKEVQILDASYLVRAQTEEGNTVLMVIDPPLAGSTSGSASGSSSGSSETNN
ncbi:hypothetical protein ASC71_21150 [Rhizobium sp. Root1240]|uniref:hypothetical protein n=1 Tax=unclassified Rhizobium TaxID=2613769 RepID=UPI0007138024|nr:MULTISPECIES: hypothetical protein [unclassified Rhizobium]KQW25436.1 hypothetical protein ASC71_21150 [Rhizobium sp. Root1240]